MTRLPLLIVAVALTACASERRARPAIPTAPAAPGSAAVQQTNNFATDVVYYLDGKEITAKQVETLDPKSIESVEVLKGESARRILGDRAAYGIVLITSKGGAQTRR